MLLVVGLAAWFALTTTPASTNRVKEALDKVQDCPATAAIEPLATLPAGLAVADVNLGPYLVALTRLNALSAPYHRLGASIMAAHEILHSPPAKAEPLLRQTGASYVITCLGLDSTTPARADAPEVIARTVVRQQTAGVPRAGDPCRTDAAESLASRPIRTQSSAFRGRCISCSMASLTLARPSMTSQTAALIGMSMPFSSAMRRTAAAV